MPTLNDLSLRQLEYVVAVADTRVFHRAAERCNVSQPTLSAQIAQLETVLGLRVFERDRRGVLVTPGGEEIVARARRILIEVGDLISAATRAHDPLAGVFRLGIIPTVAPYLLPDVMPKVHEQYPNLRLIFREEKTEEVVRDLAVARLDAGLLALEADLGDHAEAIIAEDPFVVAMPKGHPLGKRKRIALSDLESEQVLLLDDGHCMRTQALALCGQAGAREADLRATSLGTLVQMVSVGAGITLLPRLAVDVENRRGQLDVRPFTPPAPRRTLGLIWRTNSPFSDAFVKLAGAFRAALKV